MFFAVRFMIRTGSSPHTRGTRSATARNRPCPRFIPAYAGNASRIMRLMVFRPVHPRIRGERVHTVCKPNDTFGSSPHTRGTPGNCRTILQTARFIPAYAGNAAGSGGGNPVQPVHPRIRGERSYLVWFCRDAPGSSPHTRGTQVCEFIALCRGRFIPAYAGNA